MSPKVELVFRPAKFTWKVLSRSYATFIQKRGSVADFMLARRFSVCVPVCPCGCVSLRLRVCSSVRQVCLPLALLSSASAFKCNDT